MDDIDCFLFIDMDIAEEERSMSVVCVECHDQKIPETGVFYEGSKEGYSNFNWVCCMCGKLIHKVDGEKDYK